MENKNTATNGKVTEIPVTGMATLQNFTNKDTGKNYDYVAIELNNPFEAGTLRVTIIGEGSKAIFSHEAKKILVKKEGV